MLESDVYKKTGRRVGYFQSFGAVDTERSEAERNYSSVRAKIGASDQYCSLGRHTW